jgi:hypothetical protein
VKKGGKPEILPVEAVTNRSGLVASDAMQVGDSPENLRMIRIGELDARTGKPMNKELAGDIGYVRGFIAGQKVRMQQGNGSVKGFQGF